MIYDKEKVKTYKKIIKQQNKDKKAKNKLKKIEHKKRLKYCNEIVKLLGNYFDAGVKGYYIDLNGVDIIINSGKCAHGKIKNLQDANWEKFKELVSAKIDEVMEKVLPKEIIKPLCAKCKTELRGDFCHKCGWTNAPYDGIKEDVLLKSFRDNCMYNYAGKMGIDSIKARSVGARFEPIEIHPSVDRVKCKECRFNKRFPGAHPCKICFKNDEFKEKKCNYCKWQNIGPNEHCSKCILNSHSKFVLG